MHNSVLWFIAVIVYTNPCATSFDFFLPTLKSMHQSASSLTRPIQNIHQIPNRILNYTLYDAYKDLSETLPQKSADVFSLVNPLNYLPSTVHGTTKIAEQTPISKNNAVSSTDLHQNTDRSTSIEKQQDLFRKIQYYPEKISKINAPGSLETVTPKISTLKNYTISGRGTLATPTATSDKLVEGSLNAQVNTSAKDDFMQLLEQFQRTFYQASYQKFISISQPERRENGITFAQSGLFLYLQVMALCTELDTETTDQIKQSLGLKTSCAEQVQLLKEVMYNLPTSSDFLKFRWSSRLVLRSGLSVRDEFLINIAPALQIYLEHLHKTHNSQELTKRLNNLVETDSGGVMHNTFEEEELSNGFCAVWLTTMYMRARWRSAPTVLNESRLFYNNDANSSGVRMIRINDIMRYADLPEWDAEAIEIRYAQPELTLLLLVPRGRSLKSLANWISSVNLQRVYEKMQTKRVAVTLPIYTLRMTLLLPGKLEMMGLSGLVTSNAHCESLKLSHAVQRIMFWAEAGRNAFKDDGIEWDEAPELERIVDRPYIFYVRWRNLTLLNGNFAL